MTTQSKERALPDNPSKTVRRDTRRRFEQWARNPTCQANTLSAVHNVPMAKVAKADGATATMGQSPFAIARGQAFERSLYRRGGQAMFQALKESGVLPESASGLEDLRLRMNGGRLRRLDEALDGTADLLRAVAGSDGSSEGPWLAAGATVSVPGGVMLPEAILVLDALAIDRSKTPARLIVGEIKTYPDRGGYTDHSELATARAQAGVYVHGLQLVVEELGLGGALDVARKGFSYSRGRDSTGRPYGPARTSSIRPSGHEGGLASSARQRSDCPGARARREWRRSEARRWSTAKGV